MINVYRFPEHQTSKLRSLTVKTSLILLPSSGGTFYVFFHLKVTVLLKGIVVLSQKLTNMEGNAAEDICKHNLLINNPQKNIQITLNYSEGSWELQESVIFFPVILKLLDSIGITDGWANSLPIKGAIWLFALGLSQRRMNYVKGVDLREQAVSRSQSLEASDEFPLKTFVECVEISQLSLESSEFLSPRDTNYQQMTKWV